jgi:hypothetical protein
MSKKDLSAEVAAWAATVLLISFMAWMFHMVFNEVNTEPAQPESKYYELSFPNGEVYTCAVWEQTITCDYYGE